MKLVNILGAIFSAVTLASFAAVAYSEVLDYKTQQAQELYEEQHHCLALNLYHEARSDSQLGQMGVAFVTLNRVNDNRYPDTVCDVVYQARLDANGNPRRNQCQFSWYCDGKADDPTDLDMWGKIEEVAHKAMQNYGVVEDFTEGAVMYHASYVNPYWVSSYDKTVRIDTHIFYK